MFGPLSIEQFIDVGFVLLVSGACLRSLLMSTAAQEERSKLWKHELAQTTDLLRELVAEASATSSNLDRTLVRRKQELEDLLGKLENAAAKAETLNHRDDELPNDSWRRPLDVKKLNRNSDKASRSLEQLIEQQPDRVSLSSKPLAVSVKAESAAARIKAQSQLAKEIKVTPADPEDLEFHPRNSVIDPVAYKVARRLLARGQEIHVVARKLELPLSEVRLLDKMIRQESDRGKSQQLSGLDNFDDEALIP